jgi:hypothetical protein
MTRPALRTLAAVSLAAGLSACRSAPTDPAAFKCPASVPAIAMAAPDALADTSPADLERMARDGDAIAARVLGDRYRTGSGVPADPAKARSWYYRAAFVRHSQSAYIPKVGKYGGFAVPIQGTSEVSDPIALYRLGALYLDGAIGKRTPADLALGRAGVNCAQSRGLVQAWLQPPDQEPGSSVDAACHLARQAAAAATDILSHQGAASEEEGGGEIRHASPGLAARYRRTGDAITIGDIELSGPSIPDALRAPATMSAFLGLAPGETSRPACIGNDGPAFQIAYEVRDGAVGMLRVTPVALHAARPSGSSGGGGGSHQLTGALR